MTTQPKYLIIHHGNCWDGAAAAYCTMCHLQKVGPVHWEDIIVQPWNYGDKRDVVEYVQGLDGELVIYIVDFSFNRATLQQLCTSPNVHTVTVVDHHKTAQAELENWLDAPVNFACTFDMERSGARMCFNMCCVPLGPAVEQLVNYIQDRDLWEWKLIGTTAVMAWMDTMDRTPANFALAVKYAAPHDGLDLMKAEGLAILKYQARVISEHVARATMVKRGGYTYATVNATTLTSEIGSALLEKFPEADVAHMYNDRHDMGKRIHSLRSRKANAGGVDVSAIAKAHGGGGHYSAAGYKKEL
jgi:nanoRNase/pAp phosphatase (c-di-AMP/oligoRNAs hydrolase)